jgi:anti-sigma-K factor RskA
VDDCEHRELAAAYALGALDRDDESWYEAHLATCDECSRDVESFRGPLLVLAHTGGPADPPPALRSRILADLAPRAPRTQLLDRLRSRRPALGFALAAAAAVLVAAVLMTRGPATPSAESLLGGPVAAEIALAPAGTGRVLLGQDGKAVAEVTLADAPEGKVYEAWVMRGGDAGRAEPAGLVDGSATIVLTRRARPGDVIGFTLEPDGGSPAPTSQPVASASA